MSITTVITNKRLQAVRLPMDAHLPEGVKRVHVRVEGANRILSPVGHDWEQFFLNGPQASDDFMADRLSGAPGPGGSRLGARGAGMKTESKQN